MTMGKIGSLDSLDNDGLGVFLRQERPTGKQPNNPPKYIANNGNSTAPQGPVKRKKRDKKKKTGR